MGKQSRSGNCVLLYLIILIGGRKIKFHPSNSLIKEWTMTACAFKEVLLISWSARLQYIIKTSIRKEMHLGQRGIASEGGYKICPPGFSSKFYHCPLFPSQVNISRSAKKSETELGPNAKQIPR